MFENRGVNFRVVTWIVGQTTIDTTTVVMQGLSLNEKELAHARAEHLHEKLKKITLTF